MSGLTSQRAPVIISTVRTAGCTLPDPLARSGITADHEEASAPKSSRPQLVQLLACLLLLSSQDRGC